MIPSSLQRVLVTVAGRLGSVGSWHVGSCCLETRRYLGQLAGNRNNSIYLKAIEEKLSAREERWSR